ncbi:hypothetical protein [Zooshikella ganghwensis]|uniref:Thioredoxin domain-containing protein n=1 Tax=Zooshikella ganghwensis TaxID=202772 RepID=A0A4V1IMV0_9GAMM|nr:hypothetical protein [Zooshikella ganghwensis]RDH41501.1 hypothetical protein B9G39_28200 [Zooshikella ganghwensis]
MSHSGGGDALYCVCIVISFKSLFKSGPPISFTCSKGEQADLNKILNYIYQISKQEHKKLSSYIEKSITKSTLSTTNVLVHNNAKPYQELYKSCIQNRINIKELSEQDLHKAFRLLKTIAFNTNDRLHASYMQKLLDEKLRRGGRNNYYINEMHKIYVKNRQFSRARELENLYKSGIEKDLPAIKTANIAGRSFMQIKSKAIVQKPFLFPKGGYVIVITSPFCGPSRRYTDWLKTKPNLFKLFSKHSSWLIPVEGEFNTRKVLSTNSENFPIEMKYAYKKNEWPEIGYWGTPTLYFYKDGMLKRQLVGWPPEGQEKLLLQNLKAIDLL